MARDEGREGGLTRKELLASGASAATAALLAKAGTPATAGAAAAAPARDVSGMNVILFLTDQERAIQHFPQNWLRENLPGMRRLLRNGVSFERAFTNSCMCSPARSTLMTGYFPAQHGVKYTLEDDMAANRYPQIELRTEFKNLATVMTAAGYNVIYKGKWHCSKTGGQSAVPAELARYGFGRWNPPDAGANQDVSEAGGGSVDNDGRFMNEVGNPFDGDEGVLQYLSSEAARQQPFFMVISLVNPHDVLFWPSSSFTQADYDDTWTEGDIDLPATVNEDLSTKPSVQAQFVKLFNLTGQLDTRAKKLGYLNFYGNLMKSSDAYLSRVLNKLEETGLDDDTLIIRTADHGEMGLTHGGMRQKNFNFYEEATRVPLVYSNPRLYPRPQSTDALVSHVDFLPTLASLAGAPDSAKDPWEGVDYSPLVLAPETAKPAQDYVAFTYDDFQSGQAARLYPRPPNHIVSIRERRWKLAYYYDPRGRKDPQWEMYDLKHDPAERTNLAFSGYERTKAQELQFRRLQRKLERVQEKRLQPLADTPESPVAPS